jgi:eukaryotic-like serine/threonine-protein kinase
VRQSDLTSAPTNAPEAALSRGAALGRFVVLGLVGRGAMGEVYGAYDPELDRKIAIKLVRAREAVAGDVAERRTRLMREAQATAKISHPNVVVVYDVGTFGERVFIAMEFVEGHTLRFWLQARERTWNEIVEAFVAAGRGLAAAHDKELVHRDFKPDNVMMASSGQVRVMDFGLARVAATSGHAMGPISGSTDAAAPDGPVAIQSAYDLDATQEIAIAGRDADQPPTTMFREKITATGAVLGTPAYMSPEQFLSQPADARSDQFSFCVALYEALYGARPFFGRTLDELAENVVAGRLSDAPAAPRTPGGVRKVLERGLRASPSERYLSMNALLADLEKLVGSHRGGYASGAAAKLAGVWEAPVGDQQAVTPEKDSIRRAFLATGKPYASAAFTAASAVLDRYAQRWTDLYVEVCEATHVRGEQSTEVLDLRMACLMEGIDDLKALCRLFRAASAEVVANADKAAASLGTLERCSDIKLLRAMIRPPDDAATRAVVEQLRARLVDVRAVVRVGRISDGLALVAPFVEEARRASYGPLLAEVLLLHGRLLIESVRAEEAVPKLAEAFSTAELARHDEAAAEAAVLMIAVAGYYQSKFEAAEIWSLYAETLLRRMGGHDLLWGWFFTNRGQVRELEGRLPEAIEDARRAIAAKERALGANTPDFAGSVANLANHLAFGCDFAGAIEANQRAVDIQMEALGPDHPLTARTLANQGQFLYRTGRFEEGRRLAEHALAVFERETDPKGMGVTFPLRTLGLCLLASGRFEDAVVALERAATIREALEQAPLRLAEVHYPLARALDAARGDRDRAVALARRARREYEAAPKIPVVVLDLADLDQWIAAHPRLPAVGSPKPARAGTLRHARTSRALLGGRLGKKSRRPP